MKYRQVDVFSREPLAGNGLAVFFVETFPPSEVMQKIAIEMRQFESIFLQATHEPFTFKARIYTMEEEIDFAGHPVLGAVAALHEQFYPYLISTQWQLKLNQKNVFVNSKRNLNYYETVMEQGIPVFINILNFQQANEFINACGLSVGDLAPGMPLEVVSTGLPYLLIPVQSGIERTHITHPDFEKLLANVGAKFSYIFDVNQLEARSWDNNGKSEDIATGSAAGPLGAYLVKHRRAKIGETIYVNQGRFVGRPSKICVKIGGMEENITSVQVSGDVCMLVHGELKL